MAWLLNFILNLLADKLGIRWATVQREKRLQRAGVVLGAAQGAGAVAQAQAQAAVREDHAATAEEVDDVMEGFK